ncbi:hypothetical protein BDA96_07G230900 [Sorghum bicolor]|uniref:Uncharacterized protein n=2 Tax=Sorghum bicolor TaxID=4558 RepID=A0A921QQP5_SORBI|nr:hypothetical protein BDA96_07G230900 [Sorghum bicolor]OQU80979.1 hypothetical protein SORBI_3007G217350 [Sorghum bicolor]
MFPPGTTTSIGAEELYLQRPAPAVARKHRHCMRRFWCIATMNCINASSPLQIKLVLVLVLCVYINTGDGEVRRWF